MHPVTVPPLMPRDVCVEIMWELIHSPEIVNGERDFIINNLRRVGPPLPGREEFPGQPMLQVMDTV